MKKQLKFKGPIKVGTHTVHVDRLPEEFMLGVIGRYDKETIHILDSLSLIMDKETLLHELMHCAAYFWNCNNSESKVPDTMAEAEECFVNGIGVGLFQILSDNPKLRKYLWG